MSKRIPIWLLREQEEVSFDPLNIVAITEGEKVYHIIKQPSSPPPSSPSSLPSTSSPSSISGQWCSCCCTSFPNVNDYRSHVGSLWHQVNMKRINNHLTPFNQQEFQQQQQQQQQILTGEKKEKKTRDNDDDDEDEDENDQNDPDLDDELRSLMLNDEEEKNEQHNDDDDHHTNHSSSGSAKVVFFTAHHRIEVWKSLLYSFQSYQQYHTHKHNHIITSDTDTDTAIDRARATLATSLSLPSSSSTDSFSSLSLYYLHRLSNFPSVSRIAIFLSMGGRFAAAIFHDSIPLVHKSFVRYTTRKKQGGSQQSHDGSNMGHTAHSIGAAIRRKETRRFIEEVHLILQTWKHSIQQCQFIFLFAPGLNKQVFFTKTYKRTLTDTNTPASSLSAVFSPQSPSLSSSPSTHGNDNDGGWNKNDPRLRSIPFSVYRPTFDEVCRVHQQLTTVIIQQRDQQDEMLLSSSASYTDNIHNLNSTNTSHIVENNIPPPLSSSPPLLPLVEVDEILVSIIKDDLDSLRQLYRSHYQRPLPVPGIISSLPSVVLQATRYHRWSILSWLVHDITDDEDDGDGDGDGHGDSDSIVGGGEDINEMSIDNESNSSLITCWSSLHWSCYHCDDEAVNHLLLLGADPTLRDSRQLTPYQCIPSGDRGQHTRTLIRRWAAQQPADRYDWKSAGFTLLPLLNDAAMAERQALIKKKEKEKKKAQKQRQKERKEATAAALIQQKQAEESAKATALLDQQREAERNANALLMEQAWHSREAQLSKMSDREKRAIAAERRLNVQKGKTSALCDFCRKAILSVPFERLHYKYDTLGCLQGHTRQLENQASMNRD